MVVTVYTKPQCVQCNMTYRALDAKGINYHKVDITEDDRALAKVKSLGYMQAPVVIAGEDTLVVQEPYVLCVPTYGKPEGAGNVPPQVVKFLNVEENRRNMVGVIGAGNTNFGPLFGIAADIVSAKCDVPVLFKFELMGTPSDVDKVNEGLEEFWKQNFPQR